MRFEKKTVLVTGASSGIGAATARLLAAQGANLVLTARGADRLDTVAQEIAATGAKIIAQAGDVADTAHMEALVARAESEFGALHGAFNNAGSTGDGTPVTETSRESWDSVIATNLTAAFIAAKAQVPALTRSKGALLFTSSFVGPELGLPGMGAYAAAKAGVTGLVKVLAVELGQAGVRVNAILPGGTKTAMAGDDPSFHDWAAQLHALKRLAGAEEIARVAAFLLSDEASFVTGAAILADGGNSVNKT
ncbi:SDR family oxidoreductase [Pseudooceanicola sp. C21-150M6]|uniref:SDR family oxidoreductase n=1 Tax=Pseudooceanicola sp. C21-150M6 TaxID=3434355 RepID=UPI003D7FFC4C